MAGGVHVEPRAARRLSPPEGAFAGCGRAFCCGSYGNQTGLYFVLLFFALCRRIVRRTLGGLSERVGANYTTISGAKFAVSERLALFSLSNRHRRAAEWNYTHSLAGILPKCLFLSLIFARNIGVRLCCFVSRNKK
jgi:hypothetical protein